MIEIKVPLWFNKSYKILDVSCTRLVGSHDRKFCLMAKGWDSPTGPFLVTGAISWMSFGAKK